MSPSPRIQSEIRLPLKSLVCLILLFQGPTLGADVEANQQMWNAVSRSDARTLRRVLYRADPNATRSGGETPLMVAAAKGDFACARELLVIMGPFLATYALARITILDCRRRARRFDEMQWFLLRLADTLRDCTANSSRLKIIEHAERMMIEEQHEWFSATRNFSV